MPAHKKIQPTKPCRVCNRLFSKPPHKSHAMWELMTCCSKVCGGTRANVDGSYQPLVKFCASIKCRKPFLKAIKDTHTFFATQEYCSIACGKIGKINELSASWKGDSVGYSGIHIWMRKTYGKPSYCEKCNDTTKRMYHWANISGEYKRDRKDWRRLCVKCHKEYDKTKLSTVVPQ